ncbi:phage lytic cycle repressor MrpR family protein [Dorea sp. D27]|uniref:phage lytic cycle repressor MrpR family protein n=1 Tax=Dorea sp. D27 TaxID=658665 RepID=UPI0006733A4B|nr:hypothetical protein [Dorea sp. D27]
MYNEQRKNEYLEYKKKDYLKHLFIDSEKYEAELGRDLCEMETSELLHYLIRYDGFRTFEDKRRQLSNYVEWCVIKGYAAFNWISLKVVPNKELKEIFLAAKEEFYISKERYRQYVDRLMDSGYGVYIASAFASIYEGISGKGFYNMVYLRRNEIDEKGGMLHLPDGTDRIISQELADMLIATSEVGTVRREKTVRYVSSLYPDSVWKIRKNETVTYSKLQRKFVYLIEEMKKILGEKRISKTSIERSGYFNRIYYEVLADGMDIRKLDMGTDKEGVKENLSYGSYFESSGWNMDMRKFIRSYQSYLDQI